MWPFNRIHIRKVATRGLAATVCELTGFIAVTVAAWLWQGPTLGIAVAGAFLVLIAQGIGGDT